MKALDRKLRRDLWRLKGQVLTIALVVGCGIAAYVSMQGTMTSLRSSQRQYYETYRFAEAFAHLERAPLRLRQSLQSIPGVALITTRIVEGGLIPMPEEIEASRAVIVGLPPEGQPRLNDLHLTRGRALDPAADDEIIVSNGFGNAFELEPGDSIPVVLGGIQRSFRVVGFALSPEYVFPTPPGQYAADDRRFAIVWANHQSLASTFQMEGAFNDVVLTLQPNADLGAVTTTLDRILEPYGGLGAYGRARQLSHLVLTGELQQLETMATIIPLIFLGVAAFLLNVVLSRLIYLQRPYIATLKAVGYSNLTVGVHYFKLVSAIVAFGAVIGLVLGAWLGSGLTNLYKEVFRFPLLHYRLDASVLATGAVVSTLAAFAGAGIAVRSVVRLPPAEAMRPPAPTRYSQSLLDRLGVARWLGMATMMIVRELRRRPLRFALSAFGIACGIGVLIVGRFSLDSLDYMLDVHLHEQQPAQLLVELRKPVPTNELSSFLQLPGVIDVEGMRSVPVRLSSNHKSRDTALLGIGVPRRLRRIVTRQSRIVEPPQQGLLLTDVLADVLSVNVGDSVEIAVREGDRRHLSIPVTGIIDETFGMQGYLVAAELYRALGEDPLINTIFLRIDSKFKDDLLRRLKDIPGVASATHKQRIIDLYREQTGESMGIMTVILTLFAAIIAVGVVYNNARISLSLRSRDLASLRVLGFTRREISAVLIGELALQVIAAIPIGLLLGTSWSFGVARLIDPETFRLPVVISQQTYAYAVTVAVAAGTLSAFLVRRKLDKLDLIAVLKTRE